MPKQIEYLVSRGCIPPLCALLTVAADPKTVGEAFQSLENILKVGEAAMRDKGLPENKMAQRVKNAGGLEKIGALQHHKDVTIHNKALNMLERLSINYAFRQS